jgi:hypothetical protein
MIPEEYEIYKNKIHEVIISIKKEKEGISEIYIL